MPKTTTNIVQDMTLEEYHLIREKFGRLFHVRKRVRKKMIMLMKNKGRTCFNHGPFFNHAGHTSKTQLSRTY